jgi:hypothetical protein
MAAFFATAELLRYPQLKSPYVVIGTVACISP